LTYSVPAESSTEPTAPPMGLTGVYRTSGGPVQDLEAMHRLHGSATDSEVIVEGALGVAWSSGAPVQRAQVRALSCTFDGYLYERAKLARELGVDTASDAELVVRGYERYGEKLLTSLRGCFTLALWDGASQRGLLCSDLLSSRPLFLWRGIGYLAFAGELRDLLSMLPSRPGPDSVGFLSWLGGWNVPVDRTLYEGISRLSPGHLVELAGDCRTRPYWQPRYAGTMRGSREELAEGLRAEVEKAVAKRLSPNASGVVLSGGLDSSIVTAAASEVRPPDSRLRTYSAVFPGTEYDESWKIKSLTSALGVEADLLQLEPQGGLWLGLNHVKRWGLPLMSNALLIDSAAVTAASGDGIEVVMEGQMGDEVFGGAPWLVADRLMRGRLLAALDLVREWPARTRTRRILKLWGVKGAAPYALHRLARHRGDPNGLAPPWLLPRARSRWAELADPWSWKASGSGPRWWRYQSDTLIRAPHRELRLEYLRHRAADAGVLNESPLYDFDLIDYCLRLPPELAFDRRFTRPLAREAMRGLIPDDVRLDGNKAVFSPFCFEMVTGADAAGIETLLTAPDAELGAYADMGLIRRMWRDERPAPGPGRHTTHWGSDVWRLAIAECWLRSLADPGFADEMLAREDVLAPRLRGRAAAS
jgi:asparagine synthase (glutamine-hydrolysing)